MIRRCRFPGCENYGAEMHHIIYASNDEKRHHYCRKNKKGNTSEPHDEKLAPLCRKHHQAITDYNERVGWKIFNRYEPLSCHQREHLWALFLRGEYPPGVSP
jgi:hypothetical protein